MKMTDLEKYEELLNCFGLEYVKEEQDLFTLIFLAEPDAHLSHLTSASSYESGKSFIEEYSNQGNYLLNKINTHSGFYCYFSFCKDGKFNQVGIFE